MLTTLTTVAGLLPILLETSLQAQVLIPMATSIAFGEIFATVLVLFLLPVSYSVYATVVNLEPCLAAERTSEPHEKGIPFADEAERRSNLSGSRLAYYLRRRGD